MSFVFRWWCRLGPLMWSERPQGYSGYKRVTESHQEWECVFYLRFLVQPPIFAHPKVFLRLSHPGSFLPILRVVRFLLRGPRG